MTDKQTYNIGIVLIALGALVFLGNFGLFNGMPGIIGALFLAAGGILFGRVYLANQRHIWALLVGFGFFGAAAAAITGALAGAYFLAVLASGFAITYLQNKRHWWAIIPAGVLATLAFIVSIEVRLPFLKELVGGIFFLGIAATFGLLYLLPEMRKRWAVYPALGALILAFLSSSVTGGWIMPAVLIAGGIYLLKNKGSINLNFTREEKSFERDVSSDKVTSAEETEVSQATAS
ncbi:MAG: hypothetical protein KC422_05510 [Trueperaceae bacterium]|nr:hypothetical protein [Trueperaceae bacterium]